MTIRMRIHTLEQLMGSAGPGTFILFQATGATEDDVTGVNYLGVDFTRQPGESLAAMIGRAKVLNPFCPVSVMWLNYSPESSGRRGDFLPDTWPVSTRNVEVQP